MKQMSDIEKHMNKFPNSNGRWGEDSYMRLEWHRHIYARGNQFLNQYDVDVQILNDDGTINEAESFERRHMPLEEVAFEFFEYGTPEQREAYESGVPISDILA